VARGWSETENLELIHYEIKTRGLASAAFYNAGRRSPFILFPFRTLNTSQ